MTFFFLILFSLIRGTLSNSGREGGEGGVLAQLNGTENNRIVVSSHNLACAFLKVHRLTNSLTMSFAVRFLGAELNRIGSLQKVVVSFKAITVFKHSSPIAIA